MSRTFNEVLAFVAVLAAACCALVISASDDSDASHYEYESGGCRVVIDDGHCTVSKFYHDGTMADYSDPANLPEWHWREIDTITIEEGVTYIGAYAFDRGSVGTGPFKYTSIHIPASVTEIGECAFRGSSGSITSLTFADGSHLVKIGKSAFEANKKLCSVEFPASLVTIGETAFRACSFDSVVFPSDSKLDSIGRYAFLSALEEGAHITIPKLVKNIDATAFKEDIEYVFKGFYDLEDNKISTSDVPGNVYEYSVRYSDMFGPGNTRFTVVPQEYSSGDCTIMSCVGTLTVSAKSGTDGRMADYSASSLPSWVNVTVRTVVVGSGVTYIGAYAFYGIADLTSVKFASGSMSVVGDSAFMNDNGLTSIQFASDSVSVIGESAFRNDSALTAVSFPASLTEIRSSAFSGCTRLTTVSFPSDSALVRIGDLAFMGCFLLGGSFSFPSSLQEVGVSILGIDPFATSQGGRITDDAAHLRGHTFRHESMFYNPLMPWLPSSAWVRVDSATTCQTSASSPVAGDCNVTDDVAVSLFSSEGATDVTTCQASAPASPSSSEGATDATAASSPGSSDDGLLLAIAASAVIVLLGALVVVGVCRD